MRYLYTVAILCFWIAPAYARDKATVTTKKGDTVEGLFRGATETELSIEVAGQIVKLPIADIKHVSFVGKIAEGALAAAGASPLEDVFKAFAEIQAATSVGLLRTQYADKLQATLPRVQAFLSAPTGVSEDTVKSIGVATAMYQLALGQTAWPQADTIWSMAGDYVKYANALSKSDAANHKEVDAESDIAPDGSEVKGRLGAGDRNLPKDLSDGKPSNDHADVYRIRVSRPGKLRVTVQGVPTIPHLALTDGAGGKLGQSKREGGTDTLEKEIKIAGTYRLWVINELGSYVLQARLQ